MTRNSGKVVRAEAKAEYERLRKWITEAQVKAIELSSQFIWPDIAEGFRSFPKPYIGDPVLIAAERAVRHAYRKGFEDARKMAAGIVECFRHDCEEDPGDYCERCDAAQDYSAAIRAMKPKDGE